ncbi:MAG TPA: TetR family transcriptional regulator [Candidatus Fimisoma avicola]|uniref:TetR family transcriptional regulator n=1 Tax=Candidatus Fimisoma avicola TaxID=2840826 RepID=A0A9D1I4E1_9FIRM|nr:TetR family transcriptional regulator [Candidatus Fimisoma avicola]
MPKGSEQLTRARKEEIIDACASLYEAMGFKDITIRDIGEKTSFTRTSIYNYFQTKEEIFLGLLQREYEAWTCDVKAIVRDHETMSPDQFAEAIAHTLEKRGCMLKLLSMNLYDMEGNSRIENLVDFKRVYADSMKALTSCLEKFFPYMTETDVQEFLYAVYPFLFGIYPYTTATEKQKQAMDLAHIKYVNYSIYEITVSFISKIIRRK